MVAVTFVAADGRRQVIEATEGLSLMENAVAAGLDTIIGLCGGNAYCGTCRVHVPEAWRTITGERTELEEPMIEASGDDHPGVRLSCQLVVVPAFAGLEVHTPPSQQ